MTANIHNAVEGLSKQIINEHFRESNNLLKAIQ